MISDIFGPVFDQFWTLLDIIGQKALTPAARKAGIISRSATGQKLAQQITS